jgi:hypothetical protein
MIPTLFGCSTCSSLCRSPSPQCRCTAARDILHGHGGATDNGFRVQEGLPAAVTITLAVGMREMGTWLLPRSFCGVQCVRSMTPVHSCAVKKNALIRRLHSVETLGSARQVSIVWLPQPVSSPCARAVSSALTRPAR